MSFFFRRSAGIGPFRLNFSKSGVGASFGVKGARLTMKPGGTAYITVGSHGFYYRETISQSRGRSRGASTPNSVLPGGAGAADDIVTANVSELVDSSRETLIASLNERARMFNPAFLLYATAFATLLGAFFSISNIPVLPGLPEITSLSDMARENNTRDEYSMLVVRYGQPDRVALSEPLGLLPVRTVDYMTAGLTLVLVPNSCVQTFRSADVFSNDAAPSPLLVKGIKACGRASPDSGWTIVKYVDRVDKQSVPATLAVIYLGRITTHRTAPPAIEIDRPSKGKQKLPNRVLLKAPQVPSADVRPNGPALKAEAQILQTAEAHRKNAQYAACSLLLASLGILLSGLFLHKKNTEKRTSRLFYELNEAEGQKFAVVQQAMEHLAGSRRIWRVEGRSATSDWKRNAGASTLIRRSAITVGRSNPPRVETNLSVPCISLGAAQLFFLPDLILYLQRGTFGAVPYSDFEVDQHFTRFVEDEHVMADATVVGRTWRYVNKNGGPDRRFNNNTELPVVQYGVLVLTSSHGLNIHLNTSSAQASTAAAQCWRELNSRLGEKRTPGPGISCSRRQADERDQCSIPTA